MSEVVWKDVVGYEGLYEVSNMGKVRRKARTSTDGRRYLESRSRRLNVLPSGYVQVALSKQNIKKCKHVHRLVSEAFIPNPEGKEEVNHKDKNRSNNKVENLEWATPRENQEHALGKQIKQLDKDTEEVIAIYPTAREAGRQLGILQGNISKCANPNYPNKIAYGYKWEYVEN